MKPSTKPIFCLPKLSKIKKVSSQIIFSSFANLVLHELTYGSDVWDQEKGALTLLIKFTWDI